MLLMQILEVFRFRRPLVLIYFICVKIIKQPPSQYISAYPTLSFTFHFSLSSQSLSLYRRAARRRHCPPRRLRSSVVFLLDLSASIVDRKLKGRHPFSWKRRDGICWNINEDEEAFLTWCICRFFQIMEVRLVLLLRLAWIAATLPIILAFIPTSKLDWFCGLLLGFAKRGKIMQSSTQKFTVPQRFFLHFYIMASVWTTFLLIATWIYVYRMVPLIAEPHAYYTITSYLTGGSSIKVNSTKIQQRYAVWQSVFLLLLMEVQVLRRLYESIYVFNYSPSARMHIMGYFAGLFFYIAAPLSLCCDCALEAYEFIANLVAEFIVKGKGQIPETELEFWNFVNPLLKLGWMQWIGAAVFLWGWIHQYRCHAILGSLREHPKQADEYVIPHGDWFQFVSSPHYLSEIVIYAGFVVAGGGANPTIWLLFAFVVSNLTFAAVDTHKWYLQKFEDYPTSRFAIIPFVL